MPAFDPQQKRAINLSVLVGYDPHVVDIVDTASHAVVYKYAKDLDEWAKKGCEGTLFLLRRSSAPYYSLFILNRLSLVNFSVPVEPTMELQSSDDFLIYKPGELIYGIWFFEPNDRERIGKSLVVCQQEKVPIPVQVTPEPQVDVLEELLRIATKQLTEEVRLPSAALSTRSSVAYFVDGLSQDGFLNQFVHQFQVCAYMRDNMDSRIGSFATTFMCCINGACFPPKLRITGNDGVDLAA
jgi:mRNA-decapping enzyme 1B